MNNPNDDFKIKDIPVLIGIMLILGSLSIWGYQIYYWLRYADWIKFSLLWPLSYIKGLEAWTFYPHEWLGVNKILDFIPLSIILLLIGILIFLNLFYRED